MLEALSASSEESRLEVQHLIILVDATTASASIVSDKSVGRKTKGTYQESMPHDNLYCFIGSVEHYNLAHKLEIGVHLELDPTSIFLRVPEWPLLRRQVSTQTNGFPNTQATREKRQRGRDAAQLVRNPCLARVVSGAGRCILHEHRRSRFRLGVDPREAAGGFPCHRDMITGR